MTTREHDMRPAILAGWRAGAFTRLGKDLLHVLAGYSRCGSIWPSHATLAERLQCHPDSVGRTLRELREAGWVTWEMRRVRRGSRVVRSSNLYTLRVPGEMRRRSTRPRAGGIKTAIKTGLEKRVSWQDREQARAALAMIAAERAAVLAGARS